MRKLSQKLIVHNVRRLNPKHPACSSIIFSVRLWKLILCICILQMYGVNLLYLFPYFLQIVSLRIPYRLRQQKAIDLVGYVWKFVRQWFNEKQSIWGGGFRTVCTSLAILYQCLGWWKARVFNPCCHHTNVNSPTYINNPDSNRTNYTTCIWK